MAKQVETKVIIGEFNGFPTLQIFGIRPDGATTDKQLIGFGVKKAIAILENVEAIKKFVEENK